MTKMTVEEIRAELTRSLNVQVYDPAKHILPGDITRNAHALAIVRKLAARYDLVEIQVFKPDTKRFVSAFIKREDQERGNGTAAPHGTNQPGR